MRTQNGFRRADALALALVTCALCASAVPAGACDDPANRVPNCGFDTDLSGWLFTGDSAVHVASDGASSPGCAAVNRHDVAQSIEVFSSCLAVDPATTYKVGMAARAASVPGPEGCVLALVEYSDAGCGSYVDEPFVPVTLGSLWQPIQWSRTTDAATHSAVLRFACNGTSDFVVRVDDGEVVPAVFVDGFETGDTSRWTLASP